MTQRKVSRPDWWAASQCFAPWRVSRLKEESSSADQPAAGCPLKLPRSRVCGALGVTGSCYVFIYLHIDEYMHVWWLSG